MALEWLSIPAGVVAGIGSGWASAWLNRPSAAAAADTDKEQTRLRFEERRRRVADGRQLIAAAQLDDDVYDTLSNDARYIAVRRHLSFAARSCFERDLPFKLKTGTVVPLQVLADDLDRLEDEWGLL